MRKLLLLLLIGCAPILSQGNPQITFKGSVPNGKQAIMNYAISREFILTNETENALFFSKEISGQKTKRSYLFVQRNDSVLVTIQASVNDNPISTNYAKTSLQEELNQIFTNK